MFSLSPDGAEPVIPDSVTERINRLSARLGTRVTLRALRHYAATQMLTRGIDLRTTAGRHDGGGTTLRVYTHFSRAPTAAPPKSSPAQSWRFQGSVGRQELDGKQLLKRSY